MLCLSGFQLYSRWVSLNIIQKLQSNYHFNSDNLKKIFKLPHPIVVESYVKAFQY